MNGSDCGMFSCMYAESITRGADITFTQVTGPETFSLTFMYCVLSLSCLLQISLVRLLRWQLSHSFGRAVEVANCPTALVALLRWQLSHSFGQAVEVANCPTALVRLLRWQLSHSFGQAVEVANCPTALVRLLRWLTVPQLWSRC